MDYGGYTKDLSAIHPDLSSIFILDNSPGAYRKFPRELKCLVETSLRSMHSMVDGTNYFKLLYNFMHEYMNSEIEMKEDPGIFWI